MSSKKLKKYWNRKDNSFYKIEEDFVGWYLIVCDSKNTDRSSRDYLFDTFEEALCEAKDRFGIPKNDWHEILSEE